MKKSLSVLFVEDSEDDMLLLLREFQKAGYKIASRRIQSLDLLSEVLLNEVWDLIICDYHLPGFTCLDVLKVVNQFDLVVPVIVISGSRGEEVAIEVMHAGAHDYILKDRLGRLIPAVEREIKEVQVYRDKERALHKLAISEERFRQLTENIEETFWLIDILNEKVIYVSPSFENLWERNRTWLLGQTAVRLLESISPEDNPRILAELATNGWTRFNAEYRIVCTSGEERWVHTRSFPIHDSNGRVTRVAGISLDITERKRMEHELTKMFRVMEQTADAVLVTDCNGVIEYVNPAFENMSGFNRNEVLGCKPNILKSGFQEDHFYARVWETLNTGMPFSDIFINRRKDGELYYESKTITPVRDVNGTITHYVSTGKDITERLLAKERLQQIVNYDTVTGLASRILLVDRLEQALLEARRRRLQVAVLCIKIGLADIFGDVRDQAAGERLLRAMAQRLREAVRQGVTVARLSADEFVVMDRECESREDVERLAREILAAFAAPIEAEGYRVFVSPTIGISLFPEDAEETEQLLNHATSALNHARQAVHEPYLFYRRGMGEKKGRLSN